MEKVRLQIEAMDDRVMPSALPLGGGNAQVTFTAATSVLTTPAADHTVTAPAQADAGLTISTQAPGH